VAIALGDDMERQLDDVSHACIKAVKSSLRRLKQSSLIIEGQLRGVAEEALIVACQGVVMLPQRVQSGKS